MRNFFKPLRYCVTAAAAVIFSYLLCSQAIIAEDLTYPGAQLRNPYDMTDLDAEMRETVNMPNSLFPDPNSKEGNTVTVNSGIVAGHVYGAITKGDLVQDNTVTINSGQIGSTAQAGSGNVTGGWIWEGISRQNKVNIGDGNGTDDVTIRNIVFGGWGQGGVSYVDRNDVVVSGDAVMRNNIYGGYNQGAGHVVGNTITINGGTMTLGAVDIIAGGYSGITANDDVQDNIVTINGGTIANAMIYGGRGQSNTHIIGNRVTINGGTITNNTDAIWGGQGINSTGTIELNTVNINGGTITSTIYGGGTTNNGRGIVTGNTVNIGGAATVTGDIYGGFTHGGSATGNIVTIGIGSGNGNFGSVFGGYVRSGTGNAFTGNILNKNNNAVIGTARNFETVNFGYTGDANITNLDTTATNSSAPGVTVNTNDNVVNFGGTVSGTGNLTKIGSGLLDLNGTGANTFTGGLNIQVGTVGINDANKLGTNTTTFTGTSTLRFDNDLTVDGTHKIVINTPNGRGTFDTQNNNVTIATAITGQNGDMAKTGDGMLVLTGNTGLQNGGAVLVQEGTLQFEDNGWISRATEINIAEDAILAYALSYGSIDQNFVTGQGKVVQRGTGTVTDAASADEYGFGLLRGSQSHTEADVNTFTGGTEVESGALLLYDNISYNRAHRMVGNNVPVATDTKAGYITITGADNGTDRKIVKIANPDGVFSDSRLHNTFRTVDGAGHNNDVDLTDVDVWISGVNLNHSAASGLTDADKKGGAFYVASETTLNVYASNLTMEYNKMAGQDGGEQWNDAYVEEGGNLTFHIGNEFQIRSGVDGTGTVNIQGAGNSEGTPAWLNFYTTEKNSTVRSPGTPQYQMGTTNVTGGQNAMILDVSRTDITHDRVHLKNSVAFNLDGKNTAFSAVLTGGGIVEAPTINVTDGALLAPYKYTDPDRSPLTLTLRGDTVNLNNFALASQMRYEPEYDQSPLYRYSDGIPTSSNDLLNIEASTVNLGTGTIYLRTATGVPFEQGEYLLIHSTNGFQGVDNNTDLKALLSVNIDGFALGSDGTTPRGEFGLMLGGDPSETDGELGDHTPGTKNIWLAQELNSLEMIWNGGNATWDSGSHFESFQTNDATPTGNRETRFLTGDKVYLNAAAEIALDPTQQIIVSGLTAGRNPLGVTHDNDWTFTGTGGITADERTPFGKYLDPAVGMEQLIPTGKLEKFGTGTLTFANTGGNMFNGGIDLHGGTTAFNQANQLAVGTGKAITFVESATLQPNASVELATPMLIDAGQTATLRVDDNSGTSNANIGLFLTGNVSGPGSVTKTGNGVLQFNNITAQIADTTVAGGKFRVVSGTTYNSTGMFTVNNGAELSGGGIVVANRFDVFGKLATDTAVMNPGKFTADNGERFATLTLQGTGTDAAATFDGFTYDYRVSDGNGGEYDLLALRDMNSVTLEGGTVNVMTDGFSLSRGDYLIIDSNVTLDTLGNPEDGINNGGVIAGTLNGNSIVSGGPRGHFEFELRDEKAANSQLWLTVDNNTLQTVWQGGNGIWSTGTITTQAAASTWQSIQNRGGHQDHSFFDGDLVYFNDDADTDGYTVTTDRGVIVSGMDVDTAQNITFTGEGSISARKKTGDSDAVIVGEYADTQGEQNFATTGNLVKKGTGTLTFANDAGNTFEEGIEVEAGTVAFNQVNQIAVGDGKAVTLKGDSALQFNADMTLDASKHTVINGQTGSFNTNGHTVRINSVDGQSGTMAKTGAGTLVMTGNSNIQNGGVRVQTGTLQLGDGGTTGNVTASNAFTISGGANLAYNRSDNVTETQHITGAGTVIQRGTGSLNLTDNQNNFTGGTEIESGILLVTDPYSYNRAEGTATKAGYITFTGADIAGQRKSIISVPSTPYAYAHSFRTATGAGNENYVDLTAHDNMWMAGINIGDDGAAFYVDENTAMNVNADALTLYENRGNGVLNDIFVAGNGTLNLSVSNYVVVGSGIDGNGTVNITASDSNAAVSLQNNDVAAQTFRMGTTNVTGSAGHNIVFNTTRTGNYRVNYEHSDSFNLDGGRTNFGAVLVGDGIIQADNAINVTNRAVLSPINSTAANVPSTLTLQAQNVNLNDFMLFLQVNYADSPAVTTLTPDSYNAGVYENDKNDLLNIAADNVNLGRGTVYLRTATGVPFTQGDYLLVRSTNGYNTNGVTDLNDLLNVNIDGFDLNPDADSPRGGYQLVLGDDPASGNYTNGTRNIWLRHTLNSLTVSWADGGTQAEPVVWSGNAMFTSLQKNDDVLEHGFMTGDKVHLSGANNSVIELSADSSTGSNQVVFSGLVVGQDMNTGADTNADYTLTGAGGMTADKNTAFGRYLTVTDSEKLLATGKLEKYGNGTLRFENTGVNTFNDGIDLYAGTVQFNNAAQLGDGGNGINFRNNATLNSYANVELANNINIQTDSTATLQADENTAMILTGNVNGGGVTKIGNGILQFSGTGNVSVGNTVVNDGEFRVVNKTIQTNQFTAEANTELAGNGTVIAADTISLNGVIRPDAAVYSVTKTSVDDTSDTEKIATLTLQSTNGTTLDGFTFLYDIGETANDLLKIDGGSVALTGGTVDFQGALTSGQYLIVDSAEAIEIGNNVLDGINQADGILTAKLNGETLKSGLPRGSYEFKFEENTNQIWLETEINSLTMGRTGGGKWSDSNWSSEQTSEDGLATHETVFNDGDLAVLQTGSAALDVDRDVLTSGLTVNGDTGSMTLTGNGGVTADASSASGAYLAAGSRQPKLIPTGKLEKYGNGTLRFENTGVNTFNDGIDLYAGTVQFNNAAQLGDGGNGINFRNNATLNSYANVELANNINIQTNSTATLQSDENTAMILTGNVNGGNITKTGNGILQFSGAENVTVGNTAVNDGEFRVVNKTIQTNRFTTAADTALAGNGTVIAADTISLNGIIRPDSAVYSVTKTSVADNEKIATLTLQSTNGTTLDGFTFLYDIGETANDLLKIDGGSVALTSGTVDFQGALTSGLYLIVDSAEAIEIGNNVLDGINEAEGILTAKLNGETLKSGLPRGSYEFMFEEGTNQIWLETEINSLTMNRTAGGKWSDSNWSSEQTSEEGLATHETVFNDGDLAVLQTAAGSAALDVDRDVLTSGLTVNGDTGLFTLTGNGGVTADASSASGAYLAAGSRQPKLIPTGKLEKYGNGTLRFENTGVNTFNDGIDLYAGTVQFNDAAQLGDGGNGINFRNSVTNTATLQALNNVTLNNIVNIADNVVADFKADGNTVFTYSGAMNGSNLSALNKSGTGTLRLAATSVPSAFAGKVAASVGTLDVIGNYRNTTQFNIKSGATLSGTGTLGATVNGGIIEAGGTLKPGGLTRFADAGTAPVENPLTINGGLTFAADSNFDVRITQYGGGVTRTPYSDQVKVDGTVNIDSAAKLNVDIDYWGGTQTADDFNAEKSGHFTVIDASEGTVGDPAAQFVLNHPTLPLGVLMLQGWNGKFFDLWFEADPTGGFSDLCTRHNRIEIGTTLDWFIENRDPGLKDLIDRLSDPSWSDAEICDQLDWIHGDLTPNALLAALKEPWRHPFNRLVLGTSSCDPCAPLSKGNRFQRQLWGEFTARYENADYDGNAHGFTINRYGIAVGVDQQLSRRSVIGATFQYADPHLRQETGKVEMDDYEFGLYNMTRLTDKFDMKAYIGYSHQRYDFNRYVSLPASPSGTYQAFYEELRGKTSGDSLAASIELIRRIQWRRNIRLLPVVAIDFEKAWMDGYRESAGVTSLVYDKSSLERTMFRIGLGSEFDLRERLALNARLQYAVQLNDEDYPSTGVRFVNGTLANQRTANIWGNRIGQDYVNFGIGANWNLNRSGAKSLYINYDAKWYDRADVHIGEAGYVRKW